MLALLYPNTPSATSGTCEFCALSTLDGGLGGYVLDGTHEDYGHLSTAGQSAWGFLPGVFTEQSPIVIALLRFVTLRPGASTGRRYMATWAYTGLHLPGLLAQLLLAQ